MFSSYPNDNVYQSNNVVGIFKKNIEPSLARITPTESTLNRNSMLTPTADI